MNDFLSIREFAGLMGVSVHQVRYFEEKELLLPAYVEENGYRRYGIDEMYRLSHILLLRRLGIPVAEVGRALDEYDAKAHEKLFIQSLAQIREEIGRLRQLERFTEQVLHEREKQLEQLKSQRPRYELIEREARPLVRCVALGDRSEPTARMLLRAERRPAALFEADLHYVFDSSGTALYFDPEKDEPQTDLVLERGVYLYERFEAFDDEQIDRRIEAMAGYARQRFGVQTERFILTEKSYLSLFGGENMTLELEVRVGDIRAHALNTEIEGEGGKAG